MFQACSWFFFFLIFCFLANFRLDVLFKMVLIKRVRKARRRKFFFRIWIVSFRFFLQECVEGGHWHKYELKIMWFLIFRQIKLYEDKATKSKEEFGRLVGRLLVIKRRVEEKLPTNGICRRVGSRNLRASSTFEGVARSEERAARERSRVYEGWGKKGELATLVRAFSRHNWKAWSQATR